MAVYEVSKNDFLDEHVEVIKRTYKERRDAMLEAMDEFFPSDVSWTHPEGGMFLFVTLPEGLNTTQLLEKAVAKNVAYVPGEPFHAAGGGENTMRINFSYSPPDTIREGVFRLGQLFKEEIFKK
jgi:2-aminoadipate transaminase